MHRCPDMEDTHAPRTTPPRTPRHLRRRHAVLPYPPYRSCSRLHPTQIPRPPVPRPHPLLSPSASPSPRALLRPRRPLSTHPEPSPVPPSPRPPLPCNQAEPGPHPCPSPPHTAPAALSAHPCPSLPHALHGFHALRLPHTALRAHPCPACPPAPAPATPCGPPHQGCTCLAPRAARRLHHRRAAWQRRTQPRQRHGCRSRPDTRASTCIRVHVGEYRRRLGAQLANPAVTCHPD